VRQLPVILKMEEQSKPNIEGRQRNYLLYAVVFLGILVILTGYMTYQNYQTRNLIVKMLSGGSPVQDDGGANINNVKVGNAPVKGSKDAKVTIIEFSDFSCPFCGAAAGENEEAIQYLMQRNPSWQAPLPGIMKNYVDTGKARIAFKYFPGHGTGEMAMKIALCANEQGRFWELHDLIFRNQKDIENAAKIKEFAKNAGVDAAKLESCLSSGKYDSRLDEDTSEGRAAGVSGTPAFFINGRLIEGAETYKTFQQIIDSELSK